ncbi:MAG: hypothetical protein ACM3NF_08355 [Gemmatimonadota bacterium]
MKLALKVALFLRNLWWIPVVLPFIAAIRLYDKGHPKLFIFSVITVFVGIGFKVYWFLWEMSVAGAENVEEMPSITPAWVKWNIFVDLSSICVFLYTFYI